jgi:type I restriction enzyme S subunit
MTPIKRVPLAEALRTAPVFVDGDWIESKDQDPDGDVRLIQLADIGVGSFINKSQRFLTEDTARRLGCTFLETGDVLIARMPDPIGRACVFPGVGKPAVTAVDVCIVRTDPEVINSSYLVHFLNSDDALRQVSSKASGSTRQRISRSNLGTIQIPLPPLEEQRRIAAILDKASAIRRCSEKAARNAADIKTSLFDEAFIAHDRHGHWEQIALGDLCDVQGGLQVTSARSTMPIRVPYLRVANVLRGRLDLAEIKEINCSQPELDRTRLQPKDLLVVEGHGNPTEIGRVAMWTEQPGEMVHQNHLIRVRSKASSLDPEFLCFYLNSRMGRRHLLKRANTTSGLNTISTSVVKSAPIIVPPIDEQRSFCETIRNIAQLEASLLVGSALHAQLSRSLLSESFDR